MIYSRDTIMPHFDTVCMETSCLFRFNLKRHLSFLVIKSQIVSNQNGPCLIFGHLFARIVANMNGGVCCDRDSHPYSGHRPYDGMRTAMEQAAQAYPNVEMDIYTGDLEDGQAIVQQMPPTPTTASSPAAAPPPSSGR